MSLKHHLAPDEKMRARLDAIPRDLTPTPSRPPAGKSFPTSERELFSALRELHDPENELPGLIARIKLLEIQMAKVMRELACNRGK